MGCDIHAVIEYKSGGKWHAVMHDYRGKQVPTLDFERNYCAFAMLANVRNDDDDLIVPIAEPRGLPDDVTDEAREAVYDHSFSFVTLEELLDYDWHKTLHRSGLVEPDVFKRWDLHCKNWGVADRPEEWCGGANAEIVSNEQMRRGRYDERKFVMTMVRWTETYARASGALWGEVVPQMLSVARGPGRANVRLVMGFDS